MKSLISIIIPAYNRAHLIGETLDSIIVQTYENWECIVVDDGSVDYTTELMEFYCEKDLRIQYHYRPSHKLKGANACRNYGLELSKGKYILFLDSDDLLTQNCIEVRVNYILLNKGVDFVFVNTGILINNKKIKTPFNNIYENIHFKEEYLISFLRYEFPWVIMGVLWSRKVLEQFSFDESFQRLQDLELHIRILMRGNFRFKKLDLIDNFYRLHQSEKKIRNSSSKDVVGSLIALLQKYSHDFQQNEKYNMAFKRFYYIISREFIFSEEERYNSRLIKLVIQKGREERLFNLKDYLIFGLYYFFIVLKLNNVKGIGMHRLRKFSNKLYRA